MSKNTLVRYAKCLDTNTGFVNVAGEVDTSTAASFRRELFQAIAAKPSCLVVRMAHIAYMDSAGIAVLLELVKAARKDGIRVVLLEPSPAVKRALEIVDLSTLVDVCGAVDECARTAKIDAKLIRHNTYTAEELVTEGRA